MFGIHESGWRWPPLCNTMHTRGPWEGWWSRSPLKLQRDPCHGEDKCRARGLSTSSNDSMPYGAAASASAAKLRVVRVLTFCCSSDRPWAMQLTRYHKWGKTAHPIMMAICCTMRMPVWRACHNFLLRQTALRKGSKDGIPSAEATTEKARAVVFRTYSSAWSISGHMVHMGKTSGFEQVGNDLTTFDSHIVILIDEQRFDDYVRSCGRRPSRDLLGGAFGCRKLV